MQALRLSINPGHGLQSSPLPLPMPQASGIIDPEPFRARARGEGPAIPERIALSGGLRTLHLEPGQAAPLFEPDGALVTIVISGALDFSLAGGVLLRLCPGDLLLVNADFPRDARAQIADGCRLVQFKVADDWPGDRARPILPGPAAAAAAAGGPKLKRMVMGDDGQSHFCDFHSLFGRPGAWSELTPAVGLHFIGMTADLFIDWHPEVVNNLVIVLTGELELEVGGHGGAVERFRPGDICLAQDRQGQGHIDRTGGYVQVCVLIIADQALWPLTIDAQPGARSGC